MPSDVERAYMAGLIDGEGSIQVVLMNKKTLALQTRVVIQMVDRPCLEWAQVVFGGRLTAASPIKNPKARAQSRLVWNATLVIPLLTTVLPFLKIKREQALIALEVASIHSAYKPGIKRSPDVLTRLWELRTRIRRLNHRGSIIHVDEQR